MSGPTRLALESIAPARRQGHIRKWQTKPRGTPTRAAETQFRTVSLRPFRHLVTPLKKGVDGAIKVPIQWKIERREDVASLAACEAHGQNRR
jgi:hypothetical protein